MLNINWRSIGLLAAIVVLAACSSDPAPAAERPMDTSTPTTQVLADSTPAQAATATSAPTDVEPTVASTPTALPDPTTTTVPLTADNESVSSEVEPTAAEPSLEDILIAAFPETPQAQGEVVFVVGRVLDTMGAPIAGAAVEFWQTDAKGFYDHPRDPSTGGRDQNFQFYGTSVSDGEGLFTFRTISPGYYEPRPKHIHLKVKQDGRERLTSQFYFEEDRDGLASEGLFRQAGELGELLILKEGEVVKNKEQSSRVLFNDIVIDTGIGAGTLTPTPSQGEGPYYPVVDVASYDNDLTVK